MEKIQPIVDLMDWSLFTVAVDYLIDRGHPIPQNLNKLPAKTYHDILDYLEHIEKDNAELDCFYRERRAA